MSVTNFRHHPPMSNVVYKVDKTSDCDCAVNKYQHLFTILRENGPVVITDCTCSCKSVWSLNLQMTGCVSPNLYQT